ncbi:glycoside hydrolase family 36 protein [Jiangella asiatica]|uniref:Alpha-galactosidase n=1 Tax=Jiangella asiatica TaxID=2530372 RepID=A0A4R5DLV0_9ACTN|nr:glycoside hydrolase family 36 protein [Jiangella asiatica]TDE13020.1 alpha-galactosidase [Jiangella asiatica]
MPLLIPGFDVVHEVAVSDGALVFEHGWQSFSPTTAYPLGTRPHRPVSERNRMLNYRQASHPGRDGYFSEGVLAVSDGAGAVHVVAAADPFTTGVRLCASSSGSTVVISADGPVRVRASTGLPAGEDGVQAALRDWAVTATAEAGLSEARPAPTAWCSWYEYWGDVRERDVVDNLEAVGELDLAVDVVQLDDGYSAEIGDWLTPSDRFADLRGLVERIRGEGRRAGIWLAPFFAGARSRLADEHPDWLLRHPHGGPLHAGRNWGQDLYSLDLSHPGAADWMRSVFATFSAWGIDYFKIDFIAAGAIPGARHSGAAPVTAYRDGLRLIRDAVGTSAHILGCGAPVLPSVGLVDSIRVSADTGHTGAPDDGDMCSPSQQAAVLSARGRQFMNGVFFANDPDCLIVGPKVESREAWAAHVEATGGAVVSSDGLRGLDGWALDTTRRLLAAAGGSPTRQ